jgi:hypothetical protein
MCSPAARVEVGDAEKGNDAIMSLKSSERSAGGRRREIAPVTAVVHTRSVARGEAVKDRGVHGKKRLGVGALRRAGFVHVPLDPGERGQAAEAQYEAGATGHQIQRQRRAARASQSKFAGPT